MIVKAMDSTQMDFFVTTSSHCSRIEFNSSCEIYRIPIKDWGEITYPFLRFNGCTVESLGIDQ